MADKKTPKEASKLFESIMKASVKDNLKPKKETKKKSIREKKDRG